MMNGRIVKKSEENSLVSFCGLGRRYKDRRQLIRFSAQLRKLAIRKKPPF